MGKKVFILQLGGEAVIRGQSFAVGHSDGFSSGRTWYHHKTKTKIPSPEAKVTEVTFYKQQIHFTLICHRATSTLRLQRYNFNAFPKITRLLILQRPVSPFAQLTLQTGQSTKLTLSLVKNRKPPKFTGVCEMNATSFTMTSALANVTHMHRL